MNLENLLEKIRGFLGIEEIVLDEEGFCTLQLQEKFLFILRLNKEQQRCVIAAEVAASREFSKELLSEVLAFNFQRMAAPGAWMALDNTTGALFLAEEFIIETIEVELFEDRLNQFFKHYLTFQGLFNEETIDIVFQQAVAPSSILDSYV